MPFSKSPSFDAGYENVFRNRTKLNGSLVVLSTLINTIGKLKSMVTLNKLIVHCKQHKIFPLSENRFITSGSHREMGVFKVGDRENHDELS